MSSKALHSAATCIIIGRKRKHRTANSLDRRNTKFIILREVRMEGSVPFRNFTKITASNFELLLQLIGPSINKQDPGMREAVPISTRLAVCDLASSSHSNFRYLCQQ
jgi:hypothetical protein